MVKTVLPTQTVRVLVRELRSHMLELWPKNLKIKKKSCIQLELNADVRDESDENNCDTDEQEKAK